MPTSFDRTRKAISKKKGSLEVIHEHSRDLKRLRRAQLRDEKLAKIATARKKADQIFIKRSAYFRDAVRENGQKPLTANMVQELVRRYVHQFDEELEKLKKARRPGRPPNAKEDLLKVKIANLQKEYVNGFLLPKLTTEENATLLDRWEGSWSYLTTLKWVIVASDGVTKDSNFPPKGNH